MSEQVLVVPTAIFHRCGHFQGIQTAVDASLAGWSLSEQYAPIFDPANQQFMDRDLAEADPNFKQLIPYTVIVRFGLLAAYYRGKGQGEARLRGKRSIGFGGHINPHDTDGAMVGTFDFQGWPVNAQYAAGVARELTEELRFTSVPREMSMLTVGLINDDSTEVGKVHLGIAHLLRLPLSMNIEANEEDILDLDWRTAEDLQMDGDSFESWSRLFLDALPTEYNDQMRTSNSGE